MHLERTFIAAALLIISVYAGPFDSGRYVPSNYYAASGAVSDGKYHPKNEGKYDPAFNKKGIYTYIYRMFKDGKYEYVHIGGPIGSGPVKYIDVDDIEKYKHVEGPNGPGGPNGTGGGGGPNGTGGGGGPNGTGGPAGPDYDGNDNALTNSESKLSPNIVSNNSGFPTVLYGAPNFPTVQEFDSKKFALPEDIANIKLDGFVNDVQLKTSKSLDFSDQKSIEDGQADSTVIIGFGRAASTGVRTISNLPLPSSTTESDIVTETDTTAIKEEFDTTTVVVKDDYTTTESEFTDKVTADSIPATDIPKTTSIGSTQHFGVQMNKLLTVENKDLAGDISEAASSNNDIILTTEEQKLSTNDVAAPLSFQVNIPEVVITELDDEASCNCTTAKKPRKNLLRLALVFLRVLQDEE